MLIDNGALYAQVWGWAMANEGGLGWRKARRIRRSQDIELRSQLVGYISTEMERALDSHDPKQVIGVKNVAELVLDYDGTGHGPRRPRLDRPRVWLTFLLVICLAGIIAAIVIVPAITTKSADAAAPYVSIFSGLVGIAVGWLFGTSTSLSPRGNQEALERELLDQLQTKEQMTGASRTDPTANEKEAEVDTESDGAGSTAEPSAPEQTK